MVLEIDDTAWGSVVGGVWLGYHKVETGQIIVKEIPVTFFQIGAFENKAYLEEALRLTKRSLFYDITITMDEEIRVCSGYVLSSIYQWLETRGFNVSRAKIKGKLQAVMEAISRDYVANLPNFSKQHSEPLYDALVRWFKSDPKNRSRYVKTGWGKIQSML